MGVELTLGTHPGKVRAGLGFGAGRLGSASPRKMHQNSLIFKGGVDPPRGEKIRTGVVMCFLCLVFVFFIVVFYLVLFGCCVGFDCMS